MRAASVRSPPGAAVTATDTSAQIRERLQTLRYRLRLEPGAPNAFGSEGSFDPPIGSHWQPSAPVRGYYIDFSQKLSTPTWPPYWLEPVEEQFHVATAQWGLGAFERYLKGEGEAWLEAARRSAEHLLGLQQRGGALDGGWLHLCQMPHSYRLDPPWLSAMAQGEGASLLVRLYRETGEERFAEAARRALKTMELPVADGGTRADLDGFPFVEEYPTRVPSCVLNGAIFALWGYHDVGQALGDGDAIDGFGELADALAANVHRYDTGYWSRYDLFPHHLPHVASPAYHLLHIKQLQVLDRLAPRPELAAAAERFEGYRQSRRRRARAIAGAVAFRLSVPRNRLLAHRLPWDRQK